MGENYTKQDQGELFPEFKPSGGGKFAYFKKDFTLGKKMVLTISWENLVLFSIVLIMLLALFFSMGVEKGKRLTAKEMRIPAPAAYPSKAEIKEPVSAGEVKRTPSVNASPVSEKISGPYTIQVMALKKIEDTQKEVARLSAAGYEAFLISSGSWHQVCIGRYATQA
ncbi:MAG: SPOR domain-containing protein, partial [Candidatus Omnitrophica bacterium]|nr:SPOR domain-containing protein [Candidatus Omnitrophota bacterium]